MAVQITNAYKIGGQWAINVDFNRQEYRICWTGNWRQQPDTTNFPRLPESDVSVMPIQHEPQVQELWAKSTAICYGADSHLRILDQSDGYPICKVAATMQQRRMVVDEFHILQFLSAKGAPVVLVHPQPLIDSEGMFGFRMEQLFKIELGDLRNRQADILEAMAELHKNHVVHNDFHPGNILSRSDGSLVIIDFGRSGYVGHKDS